MTITSASPAVPPEAGNPAGRFGWFGRFGRRGWYGARRDAVDLAAPYRRDLRDGCLSLAAQQVLVAVGAGVAAYCVARAVRGASYDQLSPWVLVLVVVAFPQVRLPWAGSAALSSVANRVRVDQADRLFVAIDRLDPMELADRRSGQLTAIAADDVSRLASFFADDLAALVSASTMLIVATVGVALLDWRLGVLVGLALLGVVALASGSAGERSVAASAFDAPSNESRHADIIDHLQGLREIVTAGATEAAVAELEARAGGDDGPRSRPGVELIPGLVSLAAALVPVIVLGAGAALAARGSMSPTLVPVAVVLAGLAARASTQWITTARGTDVVAGAARRIAELERAPVTITRPETGPMPTSTDLAFCNVGHRYRAAQAPALDDVSFRVADGQTLALVGHSGAGKSTSLRMLLRFLRPDTGCVRIGGHDIGLLTETELRRLVGYVPQDSYLFNTSIDQNLRLGRPDATAAEVEAAARAAQAWEFICARPDGLASTLGERGAQLSGGQRQRLAIARALLADRPILVLDEPVSHLDRDNESALIEAMSALRAGRTTVIVAHRRSTTRQADQVVVLDRGRVVDTSPGLEHHGARG